MLLTLSPKGETLLRELGRLRLRTTDIMFKSLTDERAMSFRKALTLLMEAVPAKR
jgi:DNA-binding MarR family transcriptional regulator